MKRPARNKPARVTSATAMDRGYVRFRAVDHRPFLAQCYQGRKRVNHADDMMARITADRLVQHLTESGFVLMKGTAAAAPSTSAMPSAERD
ncbi:MAG: hypothetical protein ABSC06_38315 [Rhodopila sp.]